MSIEVKPGHWRMYNGNLAIVEDREGKPLYPWRGRDDGGIRYSWRDDGGWFSGTYRAPFDLVEYLGPEEPQAGGEP